MKQQSYSRAKILWVDDDFRSDVIEEVQRDTWSHLFGTHPCEVFRLMDLSLEIARSVEEAMEFLDDFSCVGGGTYLFTVLDLSIPLQAESKSLQKNGIALGEYLRDKELPFVFLSASTDASKSLESAGLSKIPFFTKEVDSVAMALPEALSLLLLSEVRKNISWISLGPIIDLMDADSDIVQIANGCRDSFDPFPFFGSFKDYVERCEFRGTKRANMILARSKRDNCDAFLQQALSIFLYQGLINQGIGKKLYIRFGHGWDIGYIEKVFSDGTANNPLLVNIIRCDLDRMTPRDFSLQLDRAFRRSGMNIFIIPNDESSEEYLERARLFPILHMGDLPQMSSFDTEAREELIRKSSALVIEDYFARGKKIEQDNLLPMFLACPELLVDPIDWMNLLDTRHLAEELSDSYEILLEFFRAVKGITKSQRKRFENCIFKGHPLAYDDLLKVGRKTFRRSEYGDQWPQRVIRAIDQWLIQSWDFPTGYGEQFRKVWKRPCMGQRQDETLCRKENGDACEGASDKLCGIWEAWQDHSFAVLTGMMEELDLDEDTLSATPEGRDLVRISGFIRSLGGRNFLGNGASQVDWEKFEKLRWPHHHYPMPAAVTRRLRQAGRHLWIQPEALNLSAALPSGRQQYRYLNNVIDQYWSVLSWVESIQAHLPEGWRQAVGLLCNAIAEQQASTLWEKRPNDVWNALLALLRNGLPVLYIADSLARCVPIDGVGKDSIRGFLSNIDGYGVICGKLRGSLFTRRTTLLPPPAKLKGQVDLSPLLECRQILELVSGDDHRSFSVDLAELGEAFRLLAESLSQTVPDHASGRMSGKRRFSETELAAFIQQVAYGNGRGTWYREGYSGLKQTTPGFFASLFGMKGDHVWKLLDALAVVADQTRHHRYYDGYHLMACLNELRVENKDTRPTVPVQDIEMILELFLASLPGILAQLSWCVELCGEKKLARAIRPDDPRIVTPVEFVAPTPAELAVLMRVQRGSDGWRVFTLGIPGNRTVKRLCCHDGDRVIPFAE